MVDGVYERFNIDLHLAVGAWHDFAQALGSCPIVSVGTSSRRFSAFAYLIAVLPRRRALLVGVRRSTAAQRRDRRTQVEPLRRSPIFRRFAIETVATRYTVSGGKKWPRSSSPGRRRSRCPPRGDLLSFSEG